MSERVNGNLFANFADITSTNLSISNTLSGRYIASAPSQSGPFASAAAAVSHPALLPIISTITTVGFLAPNDELSRITSLRDVAIYFAAEP